MGTNSTSVPGISDDDIVVNDLYVRIEHQKKRRRKIYHFVRSDYDSLNAGFCNMSDEIKTQYASGTNTEKL